MKVDTELMGQVVTVHQEYKRFHEGNWPNEFRTWRAVDIEEPKVGWVTGFRFLQNGVRQTDSYGYARLQETKERTPCVLVVYWPTMDPVRVPLDGYELGGEPEFPTPYYWEDGWKDEMREIMSEWPRDEHGRWKATNE